MTGNFNPLIFFIVICFFILFGVNILHDYYCKKKEEQYLRSLSSENLDKEAKKLVPFGLPFDLAGDELIKFIISNK